MSNFVNCIDYFRSCALSNTCVLFEVISLCSQSYLDHNCRCPQVCKFEKGNMCGWKGGPDASQWQIGKSADGPQLDYSEQTPSGKYLYVSHKKFGARQTFTSPTFSSTGPYCSFTAEYYIGGDHPTVPTIDVSRDCMEPTLKLSNIQLLKHSAE